MPLKYDYKLDLFQRIVIKAVLAESDCYNALHNLLSVASLYQKSTEHIIGLGRAILVIRLNISRYLGLVYGLLLSLCASAEQVDGLYDVAVPVDSQSSQELRRASRRV